MYIPASFRETDPQAICQLIKEHSFGTLVSRLEGELFATHIPFLLNEEGTVLHGHMARANPHWRAFDGLEQALAIFQDAHAYISPAWYIASEAVPTWNYSVAHVYGRPKIIEDPARVHRILDETVATFDTQGWSTEKVTEEYIHNLARAIVAFELPIDRLEGKRKLSQNRPAEDALGAARGLRTLADQMEAAAGV